jgi:hypothetical protein
MIRNLTLAAIAAVLAVGPAAADEVLPEASAAIEDACVRIHGTIESPGGLHEFTFPAEADTKLRVRFRREKGENLQASLFVLDPAGRPLDVDADPVFAPSTGTYTVRVRASEGFAGRYVLNLKVYSQRNMPKRRDLWLSPHGFGPAPDIRAAAPDEALRSEPDLRIELTGENFAAGAEVVLRRGSFLIRGDVLESADDLLRVRFRYERVPKGRWSLTVTNPSGAEDRRRVTIWALRDLILPAGVVDGAEVWFLDFTDEFESDLERFGLRGDDETVNGLAREAVKTYAVRLLRHHFGQPGERGEAVWRGVRVCFLLERPTRLAGDRYNRIEIGGDARPDAPSDNPDLPWGYVPVDEGNRRFDDIGGEGDRNTAKLPTGEMAPSVAPVVNPLVSPSFADDFEPLLDRPVEAGDAGFFGPESGLLLTTDDAIARNADIVRATERLGREIAAIVAHHAARAMGVGNGDDGIMGTPELFGEFSEDRRIAFGRPESELLRLNSRDSDLPGNSVALIAQPFPLAPGQGLMEVFSGESFDESLNPVGGPPELRFEEYDITTQVSRLPVGFEITAENDLVGNPPAADPGNPGAYPRAATLIRLFLTDPETQLPREFRYRINLLVDLDTLPNRGTRAVAAEMNERTRAETAR